LNPGLPWHLQADVASIAIKTRDRVCAISANKLGVTMSHVVPAAQDSWVRVLIVISLVVYVDQSCVS
jgi:hypothetical protein